MHEIYELNADSVEQLFMFPTKLSNGDTVIRMHAKSEMPGSQVNGVINFANDLGNVSYSKAIAIDAFNDQNALPTQLTACLGRQR